MKKKISFFTIVIFTLLFLFLFSSVNQLQEKHSSAVINDTEKMMTSANHSESTEDLSNDEKEKIETVINHEAYSQYAGLYLKNQIKQTEIYRISLKIPVAESEAINEPIQQWLKVQEEDFLKNVDDVKDILKHNDLKAQMDIQAQIEVVAENLYTLTFTSHHNYNGADGINVTQSFMIDVENGNIIELADILDLNEELLSSIDSIIYEEIDDRQDEYSLIIDELLSEALKNPDHWNWSISKENLTLHFDEYEVAAGAGGTTTFQIPIEKIKLFLNKDYALKLNIPNT